MQHSYHVQDITDLDVHRTQAKIRWERDCERTVIHHHRIDAQCVGNLHEDIPKVNMVPEGNLYTLSFTGQRMMSVVPAPIEEKNDGPEQSQDA